MIFFCNLMTLMFDLWVMLWGEIRCSSLSGFKELTLQSLLYDLLHSLENHLVGGKEKMIPSKKFVWILFREWR